MDRPDYEEKAITLLRNGPYTSILPGKCQAELNKAKAQTAKLLGELKDKWGKSRWFTLYPKTHHAGMFYGLPKVHKIGNPLRPIIDYRDTPNYELSKILASILKPLQKQNEHFVLNASHFVQKTSTSSNSGIRVFSQFRYCITIHEPPT